MHADLSGEGGTKLDASLSEDDTFDECILGSGAFVDGLLRDDSAWLVRSRWTLESWWRG